MLTDKVLSCIYEYKLFDKNVHQAVATIFSTFNSSRYSRRKIANAILELQSEGKLKIENSILKQPKVSLIGTFYRNANGTGKIIYEDGNLKEIFVPKKYANSIPGNSLVNFVVLYESKEEVAQVTQVLKTTNNKVYGVVVYENNQYLLKSDDSRFKGKIILAPNELTKSALNKKCCVIVNSISDYYNNKDVYAKIENESQIYGYVNNPFAVISATLQKSGIPLQFSEKALMEATAIPNYVSKEDLVDRKDYRHLNFVTIDPATCKDMDDAVYVEKILKDGVFAGYKLYVAIADVTHYVLPNSQIDKEAYERGFSAYPAGSVIHMLPETLSCGICSLNPNVDRLAVVTEIETDKYGNITNYSFNKGVINSKHKFSYNEVSDIYHNKPEALNKFTKFKELVNLLYEASNILALKADANGALNIDGYEPTIKLSPNKDKIEDIINENQIDSHKVIEQFMIANNKVVAEFLNRLFVSNILRVHDYPKDDNVDKLNAQLMVLGIDIDCDGDNKSYQKLLKLIDSFEVNKKFYHYLLIRSLAKAKYDTDTFIGHTALGAKAYTHFTSPIRRYTDLLEHRILKSVVDKYNAFVKEGKLDGNKYMSQNIDAFRMLAKGNLQVFDEPTLKDKLVHLNHKEQVIDDLSRETDKACAAIYLERYLGMIKKGYISNIGNDRVTFTLFDVNDPEHSNIFEVDVPFSELVGGLNLYKHSNGLQLIDAKTNKVAYTLGDSINIKIIEVNINTATVLGTADLTKQPNTMLNLNDNSPILEKKL